MAQLVRFKSTYLILFLCILFQWTSCGQEISQKTKKIKTAAEQTNLYVSQLKGKKIAIVANQTSIIGEREKRRMKTGFVHLVDSLLSLGINIQKVFTPEHGFRGKADASETILDGFDKKTNLPIISLYGKTKKPTPEHLKDIDLVIFDIQDVGVRFYTYISTLLYVMEACAELNIPLLILDRPNPNGHYVDGPVLKTEYKSFVGKHPVPVVYGMTIGEYGQMINGEKWLKNGVQCDLTVIPLKNYTHNSIYNLPIRPSPNLPNAKAINLYPSLGFFEGTTINAGRGTEFQFQRYGAPFFPESEFKYTPKPNFGSKYPKHKGRISNGVDLRNENRLDQFNLKYLIDAYQKTPKGQVFFGKTFTIHVGNTTLKRQLEAGLSAKEIKKTWQKDLNAFKIIRKKYLIYN